MQLPKDLPGVLETTTSSMESTKWESSRKIGVLCIAAAVPTARSGENPRWEIVAGL